MTRAILIRGMEELAGIRCLTEVDDNYVTGQRHNPWLNVFLHVAPQVFEQNLKALCSASGIIFSTRRLRDLYWRFIKDRFGKLDLELHVCRNHVPDEDWPAPVPPGERLRVGFMGSISHIGDLHLCLPALTRAKEMGCEIVLIGIDPTSPAEYAKIPGVNPSLPRIRGLIAAWRRLEPTVIPWIRPEVYARPPLPLDIGVCPLALNSFSLGKSDVKAIEYTLSGAAVVASAHPVYRDFWRHGETCLLSSSPEDMARCVAELVRNRGLRRELVRAARQYVREERGSQTLRREWHDALGV